MKKVLLALAATLALVGCGGGLSDSTVDHLVDQYRAFDDLSKEFVAGLNSSGQMNVTIVKTFTNKANFIVLYDHNTNQTMAVDIGGFKTGGNALAYFQAGAGNWFYNLEAVPGHYQFVDTYDTTCTCYVSTSEWVATTYVHQASGLVFEKISNSTKDLEKMAAKREAATIDQLSQKFQGEFGLSAERSNEVARLTMAWKKAGGKEMSAAEHDAFSMEILGFKLSDAQKALQDNDSASIDRLVDQAAMTNGISPENVKEIMKSFMN